jgi:sulfate permease, SulP family
MMKLPAFHFRPYLIDALKGYNRRRLFQDVNAGVTVGVIALPLGMAFAIASGARPEAGIFTAIIAGFLISSLGGSRVQIGGPAGAFIVVIYGIIETYGLGGLLVSTIFAGILLFLMGMLKLGFLVRYIPVPVVIGFTNGIAILIALSQIKDFFGLDIDRMPSDFFAQVLLLASQAHTAHLPTFVLAGLSLLILVFWPALFRVRSGDVTQRWFPNATRRLKPLPSPIVVLVFSTLAVTLFNLPVETIGSRFGGIPQGLPSFALPQVSWESAKHLLVPTLTLALLGAIESLLSARIADNLTGDRHDPNQELMAQGVANVVTPLFGGLPATGTIARTVTNIRTGATSPISGIVHAFTLLAIVLIAAPLAASIPLAALAAILLHVAFNMGEWHEFVRMSHLSLNYRILMVATAVLTVVAGLTVAVEVGLVLACVFFIYRISNLTRIEPILAASMPIAPASGVAAYSVFGSLFFGAVGKLESLLDPVSGPDKALVLELHQVINLDTTGLDALETVHKTLQKRGCRLVLCGLTAQPLSLVQRSGFLDRLGHENCVETLEQALIRATAPE